MKGIEIDKLLLAYNAAGRALDSGMRRPEGATAAEWQAEDDARTRLRAGQRAYVGAIREMIQESAAYQRHALAEDHLCNRTGALAEVVDESGNDPIPRTYRTCSICG